MQDAYPCEFGGGGDDGVGRFHLAMVQRALVRQRLEHVERSFPRRCPDRALGKGRQVGSDLNQFALILGREQQFEDDLLAGRDLAVAQTKVV